MYLKVAIGAPFGGYKQSGVGRDLGEYALTRYVSFLLSWNGHNSLQFCVPAIPMSKPYTSTSVERCDGSGIRHKMELPTIHRTI